MANFGWLVIVIICLESLFTRTVHWHSAVMPEKVLVQLVVEKILIFYASEHLHKLLQNGT